MSRNVSAEYNDVTVKLICGISTYSSWHVLLSLAVEQPVLLFRVLCDSRYEDSFSEGVFDCGWWWMVQGGSTWTNSSLFIKKKIQNPPKKQGIWIWTSSLWHDAGTVAVTCKHISALLCYWSSGIKIMQRSLLKTFIWNHNKYKGNYIQCRQGEIWFPTYLCTQHRIQTEAVTLLQIKASGAVCYLIFALLVCISLQAPTDLSLTPALWLLRSRPWVRMESLETEAVNPAGFRAVDANRVLTPSH